MGKKRVAFAGFAILLVANLAVAQTNPLWSEQKVKNYLPHMTRPEVEDLLAEGLKAEETGKGTSAKEMSSTGVWGVRDLQESSAEQGREATEAFVDAAVQFIERWKELRPMKR